MSYVEHVDSAFWRLLARTMLHILDRLPHQRRPLTPGDTDDLRRDWQRILDQYNRDAK